MADDLLIVGAGGFGRETLDVVEAINAAARSPMWKVVGVVDDAPSSVNLDRLSARQAPYVGSVDDRVARVERPRYVVGIGSPRTRRQIADRLDAAGFQAATLIHPAASMGTKCVVGEGTVVLSGARLTTNIALGRHTHVNPNATIGHDTVLGDFVSVNPGANISGDCVIEDGVLFGSAAVVLNQLRVGAGAVVGGAACVVRDVPPGAVVKGVPAR